MKSSTMEGLAFAYCEELSVADLDSQLPLLRSLMRQLLESENNSMPRLTKKLRSAWNIAQSSSSSGVTVNFVVEWLLEILRRYPAATLVLDGLDRLAPHALRELEITLGSITEAFRSPLRLFLSSKDGSAVSRLATISPLSYQLLLPHWDAGDAAASSTTLPHNFFDVERVIVQEWGGLASDVREDIVRKSEGSYVSHSYLPNVATYLAYRRRAVVG